MRLPSMIFAMIRLRPRLSSWSPVPAMKPYALRLANAVKISATGLFQRTRRPSSHLKNHQAPFNATPSDDICQRVKIQFP